MSRRKVILDVDTGHDDAVAILMAARHPALDLLGITVTAGNQTLPKTLNNTLNLCDALVIDAPVYAGMTRPLLSELVPASRIHGESGFDGPVFGPRRKESAPGHAVRFIIDTVMASPPGEVSLIAVGPLTNVAMAMRLEPQLPLMLDELIVMGGSSGAGNVTPSAEFNIHADPEAAAIVFDSGAPLVMFGLPVTTTVVLDRERLARYARLPGAAARIFAASMERYSAACERYIGESPAMHDPCCVAYAAEPDISRLGRYRVDIELSGTHTRGRTVVDVHGVTGRPANASVALDIDRDRFWALLEASLARYSDLDSY